MVVGFAADEVRTAAGEQPGARGMQVRTIYNAALRPSRQSGELLAARSQMDEDFLLLNGDTLFEPGIVTGCCASEPSRSALAVAQQGELRRRRHEGDLRSAGRVIARRQGSSLPRRSMARRSAMSLFRGDGRACSAKRSKRSRGAGGTSALVSVRRQPARRPWAGARGQRGRLGWSRSTTRAIWPARPWRWLARQGRRASDPRHATVAGGRRGYDLPSRASAQVGVARRAAARRCRRRSRPLGSVRTTGRMCSPNAPANTLPVKSAKASRPSRKRSSVPYPRRRTMRQGRLRSASTRAQAASASYPEVVSSA